MTRPPKIYADIWDCPHIYKVAPKSPAGYIYVGMNNSMMKNRKTLFFAAWIFFALQAAGLAKEPLNIGDLKQQINDYRRSGAYDRDIAAVIKKAQAYIEHRVPAVSKPAIVLDIDETSLSNWPQ